jgi:transcriptional regulator with XRE-family HTH domain
MAGRKTKKPPRGLYLRRVLARNVLRLREARGMKQEELADAADLSQSQVSQVETAKHNIRMDVLHRLANALGVRVADLLNDS